MTTCVDLRTLAGKRYRIGRDPAYQAEHGERGRPNDAWLLTIPCQYGHLYPHGGNLMAFASNSRGAIARAVAALPGVTVTQDADDGINAVFPVELFATVAKIVKPKRRRVLTPEHRAKLMAASKPFAKGGRSAVSEAQKTGQIPALTA